MSNKYCHLAILLSLSTWSEIAASAQEIGPSEPVQARTTAVNAARVEVQLASFDLGGSALADITARVGVVSLTNSEVRGFGNPSIQNNLSNNIQIQIGKTNSLGQGADASGDNAIAIGTNSQAENDNSIAIGSGVTTTRDNQIVLGNGGNPTTPTPTLYTLPGLAPRGSFIGLGNQPQQTDDTTRLVTTDSGGNLGTSDLSPASIYAFQKQATTALNNLNQEAATTGKDLANFRIETSSTLSNLNREVSMINQDLSSFRGETTSALGNLNQEVNTISKDLSSFRGETTSALTNINQRIDVIGAQFTNFRNETTSALTTVNQQIESIGALAAAFSALPAILPDSSSGGCGIGSGLFGSGVAGSIGCIGRFADNLYVNAGVGITSGYTTPFGSTASVGGRLGLFVTFP